MLTLPEPRHLSPPSHGLAYTLYTGARDRTLTPLVPRLGPPLGGRREAARGDGGAPPRRHWSAARGARRSAAPSGRRRTAGRPAPARARRAQPSPRRDGDA